MNYRGILFATVIGISAPVITEIAFSRLVLANPSLKYLNTKFYYSKWSIYSKFDNDVYAYNSKSLRQVQQGEGLKTLETVKKSDNQKRQVNISRKNLHRYRIAYRPNDPSFIRLQVFNSEGQIILNFTLPSNNS